MPTTTTQVVDSTMIFILAFSFLLFAIIIFLTLFFVVRYRRSKNPEPSNISGNVWVEAAWILASLVIALAMFVYGLNGFNFMHASPPGSMNVKVTARQWSWLFTYDNGKKSTDLVVPQGRDVALSMRSLDVIHGFFIPVYRIKWDVLPTMNTHAWFKATDLGNWDILCTQYCGLQHSQMLAKVFVVSPSDFDKWVKDEDVDIPGLTSERETPEGEGLLRVSGCMDCHSLDGKKLVGPTFKGLYGSQVAVVTAGKRRTVEANAAYLVTSITDPGADVVDGYSNIMPSGKGRFSDDELYAMTAFIRRVK
jgi:cytochrome c oxidase subunit II